MSTQTMNRKRERDDTAGEAPKRMRPDQIDDANKSNDDNRTSDDEARCSIMDLPAEVLKAITSFVDGKYWPRMELVNRRFQSAILDAWHDLKAVRLGEFNDEVSDGAREKPTHLHSLLSLLYIRSRKLESISEFYTFVPRLNAPCLEQLAKFRNLKSLDFSRCYVHVRPMVKFLTTSSSRHCLEHLRIIGSLRYPNCAKSDLPSTWRVNNDKLLRKAFGDWTPLKLKTFIYDHNNCCDGAFLAGLDASALTTLSVSGSLVGGGHLSELLRRCTQLRELYTDVEIHNTTDTFAESLRQLARQCPNLTFLNIGRDRFSNRALVNVVSEGFPNLESLNLHISGCDAVSLTKLVTRLERLKRLGFYNNVVAACPQINADVLKGIAVNLKCLTSLRLPGLTDKTVSPKDAKLLTQLTELKELYVSGSAVKNAVVIFWCKRFGTRLESLELVSSAVSDSSIAIIAKDLPRLRRLALLGAGITDISLRAIAAGCLSLESADLSRCVGITATGVNAVVAGCKKLVRLTLRESKVRQADVKSEQRVNICIN